MQGTTQSAAPWVLSHPGHATVLRYPPAASAPSASPSSGTPGGGSGRRRIGRRRSIDVSGGAKGAGKAPSAKVVGEGNGAPASSFPVDFEACRTDLRRISDLSEDLLPLVATGDPQAIQGCIDRYGALIWSLARRHSPSPADAEDAVQEVYIDLWKSAERFDRSKASETTFVAMIARRRLIDRHRHRQRRPQTDTLDPATNVVADPQQKQMEASADASLAARALATLAPQEQKVILLSTYQGMSHGQISEYTGIPLGTVKTYIRRGLLRVRKILEKGSPSLEEVGT